MMTQNCGATEASTHCLTTSRATNKAPKPAIVALRWHGYLHIQHCTVEPRSIFVTSVRIFRYDSALARFDKVHVVCHLPCMQYGLQCVRE